MLGISGLTCQILHVSALILAPAEPGRRMGATVLFFLATGLFAWSLTTAQRARVGLGLAFSSTAPSALAMSGPYRYVRHPIYASYLLAWLAGSLGTTWVPAGLAIVAMGWQYAAAARQEEREIDRGPFGMAYDAYRRHTPAIVPGILVSRHRTRGSR